MGKEETLRNRIILVGNGFDLSLGLKTGYADFIFSYLKDKALENVGAIKNRNFDFYTLLGHFKIRKDGSEIPDKGKLSGILEKLESAKDLSTLLKYLKVPYSLEPKNAFIESIITNVSELGWVDIEEAYFKEVERVFKNSLAIKNNAQFKLKESLCELNDSFLELKTELAKYIFNEQNSLRNRSIGKKYDNFLQQLFEANLEKATIKFLVLNFNYTNTFKAIASQTVARGFTSDEIKYLNIHGSVMDKENPIIFGYGNDTSPVYNEMEEHGERELRRHIKSFYYPNTNNYKQLLGFLENGEFDVQIVGHSCGLSDKTLLSTIFEHPDCKEIKNYHYNGREEDFEKRLEISRHFKDKKEMRVKLADHDPLAIIPQM